MENKEKMRIYISGKITGLPLLEAEYLFDEAETMIRKKGHDVINPMKTAGTVPGMEWKSYMGIAYAVLHDRSVDAIYMLRNWKKSKGAIMEWGWAKAGGIPVFYQDPADYDRVEKIDGGNE